MTGSGSGEWISSHGFGRWQVDESEVGIIRVEGGGVDKAAQRARIELNNVRVTQAA